MVAEKGVTANVVAIANSAQPGATPTSIAFAIESPPGSRPVLSPSFTPRPPCSPGSTPVIKSQTDQPFEPNTTRTTIANALTSAYHDDGLPRYGRRHLTQAPPQVTPNSVDLAFTATLNEGQPYRLFQLTWPGSDVISTADFNKQVKMKPEDIASEAALNQSLSIITAAYFAKGFQDAKVKAPPTFDHLSHHVSYTITVVPGPQYHIHSRQSPRPLRRAAKTIRLRLAHEPRRLLRHHLPHRLPPQKHTLTNTRRLLRHLRRLADPDTHLVDLTITFAKGGIFN